MLFEHTLSRPMNFDVFGMCNALYDLQAEVPDSMLEEVGYAKGGMFLIEEAQQREVVAKVYNHIVHSEAGGSGANTMLGLSLLGGKAAYTSRVGNDEHGRLYADSLISNGVFASLGKGEGDTGISLILITPDAQRTMLTFLGQARELRPDDVDTDAIAKSRYLYVTAYLWDTPNQKEAVLRAMKAANQAGVSVALSLSDPFCVDRHRPELTELLKNHVDVIFGNFVEAQGMTGTSSPQDAAAALAEWCRVAVVTMDDKGSIVQQGSEVHEIPVYRVEPVDTTGAGDMYAAGLLYGLTHDLPLPVTGRIGAYNAAQVVAKLGPRLESVDDEAMAQIEAGKL
ncbi:MAG: 5-dehydro-2-deoxygluconokinase [Fimbriimonadaceae bacterium]|nr:5-dehydro-2-deoxygluconokinase [Fimbriimonadaceae bacterium]